MTTARHLSPEGSIDSPPPIRATRIRLDIQGLRAVAVLAVIGSHAGLPFLRGGYVGVDVFFVLSGFLITGLLVREADRTGRVSLGGFYARRARRILPAATLVLVVVMAVSAIQLSYSAVERVTTDAGWAAAFLANVHFALLGTDYFSQGLPPSPLQHYWSLSVEEQFYLVWPSLLALLLLLRRRRTPRGAPARRPWSTVVGVAAALCVASFIWGLLLTRTDATDAYFSSFARAWELGAGMLLALCATRLTTLPVRLRHTLSVGGLAAIAYAAIVFDGATPFPGYHALVPVLGTVAVLAAGIGSEAVGLGRLLAVRPLTWIGDLSYSLYLWHWPVLVLAAQMTGPGRSRTETTLLLLLILLLSAASYYVIENPIRRNRWLSGRQRRGLALWPLALLIVAGAVLGARAEAGHKLRSHLDDNRQYAGLRDLDVPVHDELAASLALADAGAPIAFPLEDLDDVDALAHDLWNYRYTCWVSHDSSKAKTCPVGDPDADRSMVVVGDSHIGQWLPAFDALGRSEGYQVIPFIKYGCVPYDVETVTNGQSRNYTECADFRDWVVEQIGGIAPDVVYVGSRGLPRNMTVPVEERPTAWAEGIRSFVERVRLVSPDVRIVSDVSVLRFDPIDCLTDTTSTMATCTSREDKRILQANRITRDTAATEGAPYLDVTDLACIERRCPAFAGGRMLYANADHLSMDWVEHVTPEFEALVELSNPS